MKREIKVLIAVATAATTLFSCTNTESTMGSEATSDTSTEVVTTEEQSRPQRPMDADTDMSEERKTGENVSVDNKLGRNQNIVALMQQNQNLSTFVELIRAADMVVTLESPAPYTVFAPVNQAFASLPAGTIEALKDPANKLELTRLLQAHVLPNRITSPEMQDNMPMKTATGDEVIVRKNGNILTVGGAQIITADVQASNGVVHVIDKLLVPPKE